MAFFESTKAFTGLLVLVSPDFFPIAKNTEIFGDFGIMEKLLTEALGDITNSGHV